MRTSTARIAAVAFSLLAVVGCKSASSDGSSGPTVSDEPWWNKSDSSTAAARPGRVAAGRVVDGSAALGRPMPGVAADSGADPQGYSSGPGYPAASVCRPSSRRWLSSTELSA